MAGFDVVAFKGPGQGGTHALSGLTFDHAWERPVGAVLDYFRLASAGLVGTPWAGTGHCALRDGTAYRCVVAWPPVFDWLYWLPAVMRSPVRTMLRRRRLMRWSVRTRARLIPTLGQIVDHTLYLVDSHDPIEVVDWFLGMNADHLGSAQVTQDVLLMCGKHDSFQFACSQSRAR